MTEDEKLLLGVVDIREGHRIRDELSKHEVKVDLTHNEKTCGKGCSPTVEVWAQKKDIETIALFFKGQTDKLFTGLDVDPNLLNQTFDPSKKEATCPACGTKFSTQQSECPDCGLMFSVPEEDSE